MARTTAEAFLYEAERVSRERLSNLPRPCLGVTKSGTCPTQQYCSHREVEREPLFLAQFNRGFRNAPGVLRIATEHRKQSMVEGTAGEGGYMSGLSRASNRLFDQHLSPSDFAKHPCCLRKENLRYSGMIVSKAEHVIAIAGLVVEF